MNKVSGHSKLREETPPAPGEPPKHDWAKYGKVILTAFLVLAALVGIFEFTHRLGWVWVSLLAFLVAAGWITLIVYADHLVTQGRYDQALRLVPILAAGGAGRGRRRAHVLTEAGRFNEAARALRDVIHRAREEHVSKVMKVKTSFDLENLGNVLLETGRFEEARRFFQDAARLYPYHSASATGMAEALLRQGVFPENALTHADEALSLFQRGAERISNRSQLGAVLATKAWALAACGRGVEAHVTIDAALISPARKTKGPLAQVHYKAGMALLALSEARLAEQHFASGAELDPVGRWGRLCADALRREKQVT